MNLLKLILLSSLFAFVGCNELDVADLVELATPPQLVQVSSYSVIVENNDDEHLYFCHEVAAEFFDNDFSQFESQVEESFSDSNNQSIITVSEFGCLDQAFAENQFLTKCHFETENQEIPQFDIYPVFIGEDESLVPAIKEGIIVGFDSAECTDL